MARQKRYQPSIHLVSFRWNPTRTDYTPWVNENWNDPYPSCIVGFPLKALLYPKPCFHGFPFFMASLLKDSNPKPFLRLPVFVQASLFMASWRLQVPLPPGFQFKRTPKRRQPQATFLAPSLRRASSFVKLDQAEARARVEAESRSREPNFVLWTEWDGTDFDGWISNFENFGIFLPSWMLLINLSTYETVFRIRPRKVIHFFCRAVIMESSGGYDGGGYPWISPGYPRIRT